MKPNVKVKQLGHNQCVPTIGTDTLSPEEPRYRYVAFCPDIDDLKNEDEGRVEAALREYDRRVCLFIPPSPTQVHYFVDRVS